MKPDIILVDINNINLSTLIRIINHYIEEHNLTINELLTLIEKEQ